MPPATVIIGLGNLYLSDEGVGVRVAEAVAASGRLPGGAEALDLGTAGLAVLHALEDRTKAVFVDCAFMDAPPGTLRRFSRDDVRSRKVQTRLSLHEGDLLQTLELAERLGQCPADVVLFGIQPAVTAPGADLSPALRERIGEYTEAVLREVGAETDRA